MCSGRPTVSCAAAHVIPRRQLQCVTSIPSVKRHVSPVSYLSLQHETANHHSSCIGQSVLGAKAWRDMPHRRLHEEQFAAAERVRADHATSTEGETTHYFSTSSQEANSHVFFTKKRRVTKFVQARGARTRCLMSAPAPGERPLGRVAVAGRPGGPPGVCPVRASGAVGAYP